MSDTRRRQLRALLARRRADGMTQARIASAAGVSQPLVSQAMSGKLVAETAKVSNLFEYLCEGVPLPLGGPDESEREVDLLLKAALSKLSDGTVDGDIRLIRLLDAIAAIRPRAGPT